MANEGRQARAVAIAGVAFIAGVLLASLVFLRRPGPDTEAPGGPGPSHSHGAEKERESGEKPEAEVRVPEHKPAPDEALRAAPGATDDAVEVDDAARPEAGRASLPVFLTDGNGRLCLAVPIDMINPFTTSIWDRRAGFQSKISDVFRIPNGTAKKVRGLFKDTWYEMDALEDHFVVSEEGGGILAVIEAGSMPTAQETQERIGAGLLERAGPLLEEETYEALTWLDSEKQRFFASHALTMNPSYSKRLEVRITLSADGKLQMKHTRISTRGSRTTNSCYLLPWPALGRRLGLTDEQIEEHWQEKAGKWYDRSRPEPPVGVPLSGIDAEGKRFIFVDAQRFMLDHFTSRTFIKTPKGEYATLDNLAVNDEWKRILRLSEAEEGVLVTAVVKGLARFNDLLLQHSYPIQQDNYNVVVDVDPKVLPLLKGALTEEMEKASAGLQAERMAFFKRLLAFGVRVPYLDDLRMPDSCNLTHVLRALSRAEGKQKVRFVLKRRLNPPKGYHPVDLNIKIGNSTSSGGAGRHGERIPKFIWKFVPPEFTKPETKPPQPAATTPIPAAKPVPPRPRPKVVDPGNRPAPEDEAEQIF